jgi:hypothetical protein
MASALSTYAAGLVLLAPAGCADPHGRFEEFVKRDEKAREGQGEPPDADVPDGDFVLPTAEQSRGTFLLAISTQLGPTTPVVSLLEVEAEDKNPGLELRLRYRPLAAKDRKTPVGPFNEWQTILVNPDGSFMGMTIHASIPGEANPIGGLPLEADLSLQGRPTSRVEPGETVDFLCGDVTGTAMVGLTLPLAGSTFTAARIKDPDNYPPVTINCQMTPAAALP